MVSVNKADIKLGFWVAAGFFLFGALLAAAQYVLMKLRSRGA